MSDPSTANTPDENVPAGESGAGGGAIDETLIIAQDADGTIEVIDIIAEQPAAASAPAPASSSAPAAALAETPLYGVGPLTVRELVLGCVWLVAFFFSFFPITPGPFASLWSSGLLWILTIGVPTVAVFLLLLRRFSPQGIPRVGSLGVDQFASVAFSVSAVVWIQMAWDAVSFTAASGIVVRTWVMWLELVLMLAGVVLTVLAPFIPVFRDDFRGRPEQVAHPNARPVRPVEPRPAVVHHPHATPVPHAYAAPVDSGYAPEAYATGAYTPLPDSGTPVTEPIHAHEAFWALAPVERDVVDEYGTPIFRIGPTAWALVVEDRGAVFVVRHEDGRVGYLHDVSDVVRG
ncbi:hypothetical protein ABCS02_25725 [Microbacterium sp. X-17]|uniref:hypothetical protein n=1 Tax=Microbacterium sp. X-17 TaxID=3144404 RepID=UPI0031F5444E